MVRTQTVRTGVLGLGLVCFIVAVWVPAVRRLLKHTNAAPQVVSPSVSGDQLIGVFVVSAACGYSRHKSLPSTIREMKRLLAGRAAQNNQRFIAVAVDVDWSPTLGFDFVKRFGPFDEILAGGNWANTGAIEYLWRIPPSDSARSGTPEVLVFERHVAWDSAGRNLVVGEKRLLLRKAGLDQIEEWVKMQAPLPWGMRLGI